MPTGKHRNRMTSKKVLIKKTSFANAHEKSEGEETSDGLPYLATLKSKGNKLNY
jgi:hypothetical protein